MPLVQEIPLAHSVSIDTHLRNIKSKFFPTQSWLGKLNRYSKDTINKIDIDCSAYYRRVINNKQLGEYISASAILHCFDGWSHFSRGIESLLSGDAGSAIHMIYYAELRAIMSFLAREGIGVFNKKHFVVESTRKVTKSSNSNGTHEFVPEAIEAWANEPTKSQALFRAIRVRGKTLNEWLAAAGKASGSPLPQQLTKEWLANWSVDLKYVSGDHMLRNEMSYRPHEFSIDLDQRIFPTLIKEVIKLWKICEPSGDERLSERFSLLDNHLLRLALEGLFVRTGGQLRKKQAYKKFLENTFNGMGLPTSDSFFNFMLREIAKDDLDIFKYASHESLKGTVIFTNNNRPNPSSKPGFKRVNEYYETIDVLAIMSRALLLLRISTGMISTLIENTNVTRGDLQFWLDEVGERYGLWDINSPPMDFTDLWDGIKTSIESIEATLEKNLPSSLAQANDSMIVTDLTKIKQFQRVCLWGMGI